MTTFDERERAFERRFVLEEEQRFHARNRRNRLLAIWASERMALTRRVAEGYVASFTDCAVMIDDGALIDRLRRDLRAVGIETTLAALTDEMERCAMLARAGKSFGAATDRHPRN